MPRFIDLTGKRFGRLKVLEKVNEIFPDKRVRYRCLCDCGNEKIARSETMRRGLTKSCGCLIKEHRASYGLQSKTHGYSRTKIYRAYLSAKNRCDNLPGYENINFLYSSIDHLIKDIGHPPKGMELDRIDPYQDYKPGNCRWATEGTQSANRKLLPRNTSGACGVAVLKNGQFRARICLDYKHIILGQFDDFWEAHQTYLMYYFLFHNEYPPEFRV